MLRETVVIGVAITISVAVAVAISVVDINAILVIRVQFHVHLGAIVAFLDLELVLDVVILDNSICRSIKLLLVIDDMVIGRRVFLDVVI